MFFNDALSTFYLWFIWCHGLFFSDYKQGIFYICTTIQTGQHIPQPFIHQLWGIGKTHITMGPQSGINPMTHRTMSGHSTTLSYTAWMPRNVFLLQKGRKEMFYLTTHSTHFIYGYMASDIWLRTILIVRKETRCCHIGYSFRLAARVLLYASSHRQDKTYHSLC